MLLQLLIVFGLMQAAEAAGRTYHVDSRHGNDENTGLSPVEAWKSLAKAGSTKYESGDRLLFKRGMVFPGSLLLNASGSDGAPVLVDAYGSGPAPVIDAKGNVAGLTLYRCAFLEVNHLEITADGGDPQFRNPGGFDPADYVPANQELIKDRGISIERLPGDTLGLYLGLEVQEDFLGNPIAGLPDLGAVEIRE